MSLASTKLTNRKKGATGREAELQLETEVAEESTTALYSRSTGEDVSTTSTLVASQEDVGTTMTPRPTRQEAG